MLFRLTFTPVHHSHTAYYVTMPHNITPNPNTFPSVTWSCMTHTPHKYVSSVPQHERMLRVSALADLTTLMEVPLNTA